MNANECAERRSADQLATVLDATQERGSLGEGDLVVVGERMRDLYHKIERVAQTEVSVMLLGETGVGKDVAAETVHRMSKRRDKQFLRLNCAALSEDLIDGVLFGHRKGAFTGADSDKAGLLESAYGGTVFLDEIGELSKSAQAKLLRAVENKTVIRVGENFERKLDVRFVSATHRDLNYEIKRRNFRSDLQFRLSVVEIKIPALRERPREIVPLAENFLSKFHRLNQRGAQATERSVEPSLSPEAIEHLMRYHWPGNIRELRNAMERAVTCCSGGTITVADLDLCDEASPTNPACDDPTSELITKALRAWSQCESDKAPLCFRGENCFPKNNREISLSTLSIAYMIGRRIKARDELVIAALNLLPDSHRRKLAENAAELRKHFTSQPSTPDAASMAPLHAASRRPSVEDVPDPFAATRRRLDRIWSLHRLSNLYVRRTLQDEFDKFCLNTTYRLFVIANVAGTGKTTFVTANAREQMARGASVIMTTGAELCISKMSPQDSTLIERDLARLHPLVFGTDAARDCDGQNWAQRWNRIVMSARARPIYIIVDALNEFDGDLQALERSITGFLERTLIYSDVKVIVTCRYEAWVGAEVKLSEAITSDITGVLYRTSVAPIQHKYSGTLGVGLEGLYSESEFGCVWKKYAETFEIKGQPHLDGRNNALYHPLFLKLYCSILQGSEAVFSVLRPFEVLKFFAEQRCREIAESIEQKVSISKTKCIVIVDEVIGRIAWRTFEKDHPMWLDQGFTHNLLASDPGTCSVIPASADRTMTVRLVLDAVCSAHIIRRHGENLKFSFETFREFWGGTYLAKLIKRGLSANEAIRILEVLRKRGQIPVFEAFRYAVLELELKGSVYRQLLKEAALNGHPEFQEMACRTIQDLMVVCGHSKALPATIGGTEIDLQSHLDDDARRSAISQLCDDVFESILAREDFTVRFGLRTALETLVRVDACREMVMGLLGRWMKVGGLRSTIALGVLPAFGPTDDVTTVLISAITRTAEPLPGFWQRRSVANAMVETFHRLGGASQQDAVNLDRCAEVLWRVADCLDGNAVFERAMLLEKYIQLLGMGLRGPDDRIRRHLSAKEESWIKLAIVRSLIGVRRDWMNWQNACRRQLQSRPDDSLLNDRDAVLTKLLKEVTEALRSGLPLQSADGPLGEGHRWPLRLAMRELALAVHEQPVPAAEDVSGEMRDEPWALPAPPLGVVFAPEYFSGSLQDHPECKERIWAVLDRLDALRCEQSDGKRIAFRYRGASLAMEQDLLTVTREGSPLHSESYLHAVRETSRSLREGSISRDAIRDLEVRAGSWTAALRSAGALIRATDLVLTDAHRVVLCPNRPPGHLAGNKICIFDNIGVAALWALRQEPRLRIAIFDADAHHGLHIQRSFFSDSRVFYCSIHEADIHPGQGYVTECGRAPTQVAGDQIEWDLGGIGTTLNVPIHPVPCLEESFEEHYLSLIRSHILPAVRRFNPDLIFIAGGTDGHTRDTASNLSMTARCFSVIGGELASLARRGIVASLEGGYDLENGLPDGVEHLLRGMSDVKFEIPGNPASPPGPIVPGSSHGHLPPAEAVCAIDVFRKIGSPDSHFAPVEDLYLIGSAEKVLASMVTNDDLRYINMDRARFGLGAGVPGRLGQAGQVGEVIACGGTLAAAAPAYAMNVSLGQAGLSPFFVGWREEPRAALRFCLSRAVTVKEILLQTSKAFDCSVPVLGIVARIEVAPGGLKARWLCRAPTSAGSTAPQSEDCQSYPIQQAWFVNSPPDAVTSCTAVGIILRPGHPGWRNPESERAFAAATTCVLPEGAPSEKVLSHVHLFADDATTDDKFWSVSDPEALLRDLTDAPTPSSFHVAHLDGLTQVTRAVVGVVPLNIALGFQ